MPKICRDHPFCHAVGCSFLHPIILELPINTEIEQKIIPEDVKCVLFMRKNLRISANIVRGAAFSAVPKLVEPFHSIELAIVWISLNGDNEYLYQIRDLSGKSISHWTHDDQHGWHLTRFIQDQNRGYKSDKNPKLRIY
jgi:hypothetical protein